MGRQHTTWIDDKTWERLDRIGGDSVSDKLRNAVKYCDPQQIQVQNAIEQNRDDLVAVITHVYELVNKDQEAADIGIQVWEYLEMNAGVWYR